MNTPSSLQAVKRLFSFPFSDPDWKNKFLIGSGLAFGSFVIPILPMLPLMGYGARVVRKAVAEPSTAEPYHLPEWDDWNELFADGLRQFGASFLVSLPMMLIFFLIFGLYTTAMLMTTFSGEDAQHIREAAGMFMGAMSVFWCAFPIMWLLMFACYFLMPVTQAHVAVKRSLGALFRVREWWALLRANWLGFALVLFLLIGGYTALIYAMQFLMLTFILLFLAPLLFVPVWFYGTVLFYHLSGLAYAEGQGNAAIGNIDAAGGEIVAPEPVV